MKNTVKFTQTTKLSKPMKIAWRDCKRTIKKYFALYFFNMKKEESENGSLKDFDVFIPMNPIYIIQFMSLIRKMLFKFSYDKNARIELVPYIRPSDNTEIGILIKYLNIKTNKGEI